MSFPELQASYYSEPYEWITAKEIKEYVCISKDFYGRKHIFLHLHINRENRVHGVKLYTFKSVNDVKCKLSEKVLQHFYFLCDFILGAISESLPFAEINLFYNEEFDCKAIAVTVKFANDIDPKEFLSFLDSS